MEETPASQKMAKIDLINSFIVKLSRFLFDFEL